MLVKRKKRRETEVRIDRREEYGYNKGMEKMQISDAGVGEVLAEYKSHADYKRYFTKGILWKAALGALFLAGFFTGLYFVLPAGIRAGGNAFFISLFVVFGAAYVGMFFYLICSNYRVIDKQTTVLTENGIAYLEGDKLTVSYFLPYTAFQEYWTVKPKGEDFTLIYLRMGKMKTMMGAIEHPEEIQEVLSRFLKMRLYC